MTTIEHAGMLFDFDLDAMKWTARERVAGPLAEALTELLDPSGPGGHEPSVGDWAIEEVRELFPRIKVVSTDEPAGDRFVVY